MVAADQPMMPDAGPPIEGGAKIRTGRLKARMINWLGGRRPGEPLMEDFRGATHRVPIVEDRGEDRARRLAAALCDIGVMLTRAAEFSEEIQFKLRDMGAQHGFAVRSFVIPTGVFVRVGGRESQIMDFLSVSGPDLGLDQINDLYLLVDRARATSVPIDELTAEIGRIRAMPPRTHAVTELAGYATLTAGLGLLQHPGLSAVIGYVILGAMVGLLRAGARFIPASATALPVLAAAVTAMISFRWSGPLLGLDPGWMLIPPLIAFLPGADLTMGVMELATRGMVTGVARIAVGINVLLLLGLGILVGGSLVDPRPVTHPAATGGSWATWLGVIVLGIGFILGSHAPPRHWPWLLADLVVIRAVQVIASGLVTPVFGAFAAGLALPIIATLIARRSRIPAQVTFLPSFWMIVPGAIGLSGIANFLTGKHPDAATDLTATAVTLAAIALGILIGTSARGRTDTIMDEIPS